jgi:hypothetical protein
LLWRAAGCTHAIPLIQMSLGSCRKVNCMNDKLHGLLGRLKQAQREVLLECAAKDTLPTDKMLRKIADLEGAISAVEMMLGA